MDVAGIGALGKRRVDLTVFAVRGERGGSGADYTWAPARPSAVLLLSPVICIVK